jgi:hypothetical protein
MRHILLGASALALAACGGSESYDTMPSPAPMMSKASAPQMEADMMESGPRMRSSPSQTSVGEPSVEQYIAYSHNLGLSLPKGQVEPLLGAHIDACRTAGTATCIVINSNIWSQDEDSASGSLSLRATPDWIDGFMGSVASDADKVGGEITQRSTNAQDLTREILDTGARLDAQRTLQGRLMGLLERRDGSLGDLLQIERELARVTGDIESIEAQLKTLRLRVSMSSLDMNYQTKQPAFSATRNSPLGEAFGDFFYNLSGAIAAVITAFAIGLPWIILIGLFAWIWLKLIWPRLRRKPKT